MNCFLEVLTPFVSHDLVLLNFRHSRRLPCYAFECRVPTVLSLVPRTNSAVLLRACGIRAGSFGKLLSKKLKSICVGSLSSQWPVCYSEEVSGEEHGVGVRCQVHQEAAEPGQPARGEPRRDWARGQHPAAGPAQQHRPAAWHLREQDWRGAHPGAVSKGLPALQGCLGWAGTKECCRGCWSTGALINGAAALFWGFTDLGRGTEGGWWFPRSSWGYRCTWTSAEVIPYWARQSWQQFAKGRITSCA